MAGKLTTRQQEILDFIKKFTSEHGYAPSGADISAEFKFSINAGRDHVMAIERKGYLVVTPGMARGIKCVA